MGQEGHVIRVRTKLEMQFRRKERCAFFCVCVPEWFFSHTFDWIPSCDSLMGEMKGGDGDGLVGWWVI